MRSLFGLCLALTSIPLQTHFPVKNGRELWSLPNETIVVREEGRVDRNSSLTQFSNVGWIRSSTALAQGLYVAEVSEAQYVTVTGPKLTRNGWGAPSVPIENPVAQRCFSFGSTSLFASDYFVIAKVSGQEATVFTDLSLGDAFTASVIDNEVVGVQESHKDGDHLLLVVHNFNAKRPEGKILLNFGKDRNAMLASCTLIPAGNHWYVSEAYTWSTMKPLDAADNISVHSYFAVNTSSRRVENILTVPTSPSGSRLSVQASPEYNQFCILGANKLARLASEKSVEVYEMHFPWSK